MNKINTKSKSMEQQEYQSFLHNLEPAEQQYLLLLKDKTEKQEHWITKKKNQRLFKMLRGSFLSNNISYNP